MIFGFLGLTCLLTGFLLPFFVPMSGIDLLNLHALALTGAIIGFTYGAACSE